MVKEATHFSPSVLLTKFELYCAGNFWMEDAYNFFEDLKREISLIAGKRYNIRIVIEHIHSSGIKQLFEFFRFIKLRVTFSEFEICNITVYYRQYDSDILLLVQDISKILSLKINLFALPERDALYIN